jgi:hypothetical protein
MREPMKYSQKFAITYWPNIHVQMFIGCPDIAVTVREKVGKRIQHLEYDELNYYQGKDKKAVYFIFHI